MRGLSVSLVFLFCILFLFVDQVLAQDPAIPALSINIGGSATQQGSNITSALKIVLLITLISFGPAMVLTMTSFTRIAIVLGLTRTTLGTASTPPNMVITGLALFLTAAIMNPIFTKMYQEGINPFMEGQLSEQEAINKTTAPLKNFLVKHSREKDLALFLEITKEKVPEMPNDVPFFVAVPAFVLSELNLAFQIGFLIAVPFLILDMVVSSVLTSMSMITLPPVVISLPLKLMLF
ncbi:MAG: flagellar type III secretion system pore protein FliP, partial [SAR324 cluster bacterium]|nr:flagellar type III secretion system pore protein FliP [SAR324 cluster bacterium]